MGEGWRPQNRGNKSGTRIGPIVSRRLSKAGIPVSPAADRGRRPGIFVSAGRNEVRVTIDVDEGEHHTRELAEEIDGVVRSWGIKTDVSIYEVESGFLGSVSFTYPMPVKRPTSDLPSVSRVAGDEAWARVQKSTVYSALALTAGIWSDEGYAVEQESSTAVRISISVSSPEREALMARIEAALAKKKYIVQREDDCLIVRKVKKPKKLSPQERMAQAAAAVEAVPATPKASAEDLGKPVRHRVTGKIVGYLDEKRFIPIEDVPE